MWGRGGRTQITLLGKGWNHSRGSIPGESPHGCRNDLTSSLSKSGRILASTMKGDRGDDSPENLRVDQVLVSERLGGAAHIAIRLAQYVRDRGGRSRAWTPGPGPAAAALADVSIPWRRYRLDCMLGDSYRHGLACLHMAAGLFGPRRIVHVHTPTVYRLIRPAARLVRARTIVHIHLEPTPQEIGWAFQDPPDLVVTCADYLADSVRRAAPVNGRNLAIIAVPNAVDLERFHPGERSAAKAFVGAHRDRPLILMMANLAPHKGQTTALHAVSLLRQRGLEVDCWFAGEERTLSGGFRSQLERLAGSLGVSGRIRFLGFRTDGPDLLRAADFLLLPSTHEGLPLSILEAQATGTAVIGSPEPGIRELVDDQVTGFIVPPHDYSGYANIILTLLRQPRLYASVTARAYERVRQRHSWRNFEAQILHAYSQTMSPTPTALTKASAALHQNAQTGCTS